MENSNNNQPVIQLLQGDDWVGLYIDGELRMEGHSLYIVGVIEEITGWTVGKVYVDGDELWDEWGSRCPKEFPSHLMEGGNE